MTQLFFTYWVSIVFFQNLLPRPKQPPHLERRIRRTCGGKFSDVPASDRISILLIQSI